MEGWARYHRKIVEWEWYTDPNTFRLFFHLVLMANHEDAKWRGQEVKRGQHITSIHKLALALDLGDKQIRNALDKLKSTNEITTKGTNKNTVVTVVNYSVYQDRTQEKGEQKGKQTTIKGQSKGNKQEGKECKNEKNYIYVVDYYKENCKTLPQAQKITDARKKTINARINDYGIDEVLKVLDLAEQSTFLTKDTEKKWLKFDWIFNPNNFIKILEGDYIDKKKHVVNKIESKGVYID